MLENFLITLMLDIKDFKKYSKGILCFTCSLIDALDY